MNRREKRRLKREEKLRKAYERLAEGGRFARWKNERPFWGGVLSILSALVILYIPLHLYAIAFIPGTFVFIGFLFGGLLLILGIFSLIYPQFSTVFGVIVIFLSVLSIMGALGGFLIGTILGIVSGSLLVGWERHEVDLSGFGPGAGGSRKGEPAPSVPDAGTGSLQA
ncbi:DUF6114 domain-containing protein [Caldibacillus debilis]|jgi:hypothetical protein|uniref:DUF6114 domain-containing protein n=1 Tax=Caldibacillus debilis TaxID=301148 RepID=UPI000366BA28|nr:DUF6114 domain-containing protein [Caldibacillus debilis]